VINAMPVPSGGARKWLEVLLCEWALHGGILGR
jgi:hypothetical protein